MEGDKEADRIFVVTLLTLSCSICAMEARLKIDPGRPLVSAWTEMEKDMNVQTIFL